MKTSRNFFVIGSMLLLFAAYGLSQNTQTQYDHNANVAKYHTFSWEKVKVSDPVWQARMQDSVDRTLRAKGWHEVKTGGDVAITARRERRCGGSWDVLPRTECAGYDELNGHTESSCRFARFGLLRCTHETTDLAGSRQRRPHEQQSQQE
jgi:hypothetical protein